MAVSRQEYNEWKELNPAYAVLHKLHAEDVYRQFGGLPRAIIMTWADYDRFIHLNDLYAYDLILVMLGLAVMMGGQPFMLDSPRDWRLAIGNKQVVAEGALAGTSYRVSLRLMTKEERDAA